MSTLPTTFEQRLATLASTNICATLKDIKHGVERETLRVNQSGGLAAGSHPQALGSALTHDLITTDFSESLLEFITPPESHTATTIEQLIDIHKFTYDNIGDEYLWPMSMPCFIDAQTNIPIARYGKSNIAKMKEVYRSGLHNRYGSMMQVISGVHFNFSLPESFWQLWCDKMQMPADKIGISSQYFSLVRQFKRLAWVIPYLFGASPALCGSFISHRKVPHPFEKIGRGTLFLPHATSLRMSDLGYTSTAQSNLRICYNDLSTYVSTLREAINLPAEQYAHISAGENGKWQQLNKNVLQIENELYSPIRPKQVANSMEKPTDALEDRGVSYLEIRSLDVNPFSPVGLDAHQIDFLDVFLLYCLALPSVDFSDAANKENQANFVDVVLKGRQADLQLSNAGQSISLAKWGETLMEDLMQVASVLDEAHASKKFSQAVTTQAHKFVDASQTFSGRWLNTLQENEIDNSILGMELAKEYKTFIQEMDYRNISKVDFEEQAKVSMLKQADIEASDTQSFNDFIKDYFGSSKTR
ncbi:glutamate--cysteine ligase [Glaciecola siphonariae]|uniref:Glutamate--cysteine ligase n=1 Tax=Glaciecola siphonariae TaxID=521012 RepID=A0ABV9LU71_9ALTE